MATENKILVTGDFDIPPQLMSDRVVHLRVPQNDQDIIKHLTGVGHYIIGGPEYLHDTIMASAPGLRHVVVMGTGTNSFVDMKAAQSHGIMVDNTPGINADAVAEFALSSVISNLANVYHSRDDLLAGGWYQKPHKTLSEAKIGIVGLGDIGSRLAKKIKAISSAEVSYFSRSRKLDIETAIGLHFNSLPGLMTKSDAVILCVTYTPETHHLLNNGTLSLARDGQILLNFSNPKVVDPTALKQGLIAQRPRRAFFDGYYNEWTSNQGLTSDPYGLLELGADKFVATSHIAAQAESVIVAILTEAFRKIEARRNSPSFAPERNEMTGVHSVGLGRE